MNTQEYGRRPYGVGFLVIGQDALGPHLYEFSPSGTSYEYYAMSIGARSQSAKTYLEKHFASFADCPSLPPCPCLSALTMGNVQARWRSSCSTACTRCARRCSRTRN